VCFAIERLIDIAPLISASTASRCAG